MTSRLGKIALIFLFSVGLAVSTVALAAAGDEAPPQETFSSAAAAAKVFKSALLKLDMAALLDLFGHEHEALLIGADPVTTRADLRRGARLAREKLTLVTVTQTKVVLVLGKGNWPFPIPLVKSGGKWRFDTAAGEAEILARRIGRNELAAIATLRTFVSAEKEYASRRRAAGEPKEYAPFVMSTPGQTDGLWWDASTARKAGPSPLAQFARSQREFLSGRKPGDPFHGYYFRILTGQGPHAPGGAHNYVKDGRMTEGFAMIAWPADYGGTGIMTFIVGPDGKVLQKNLGDDTQSLADTVQIYDPDKTWTVAAH